jgi:hypothetical protein
MDGCTPRRFVKLWFKQLAEGQVDLSNDFVLSSMKTDGQTFWLVRADSSAHKNITDAQLWQHHFKNHENPTDNIFHILVVCITNKEPYKQSSHVQSSAKMNKGLFLIDDNYVEALRSLGKLSCHEKNCAPGLSIFFNTLCSLIGLHLYLLLFNQPAPSFAKSYHNHHGWLPT